MSAGRSLLAAGLAALAAGCAGVGPEGAMPEPAAVTEEISVRLLGGGFVRCGDRRLPLDALVLELRQRVRPMEAAGRAGVLVQIAVDPEADIGHDLARLVDELYIMGVGQGRL